MSVVAKAVEEDYRSRLRGLGIWCGDDDRWGDRHGWQGRSIEDVEAIFPLWCSKTILKRGVSVAKVLLVKILPPARRQAFAFPSRNLMHPVSKVAEDYTYTIAINLLETKDYIIAQDRYYGA